jgi:hypothetical protein
MLSMPLGFVAAGPPDIDVSLVLLLPSFLLCGTQPLQQCSVHTLLSSYLAVWLVNNAGKVSQTGAVVHFIQHNHLQDKAK